MNIPTPLQQITVNEADWRVQHSLVKKLKILFYHAGGDRGMVWLHPTVLQFKTYIEVFYSHLSAHLEWLIPLQNEVSDDELIQYIEHSNADILCTSHYLWNHSLLTTQLARIKSRTRPDIKIIAGGPSIDVNINENFFDQHPYIDYAVYAAGEQAFADIVSHLVFKKPMISFNTSNCAWKNHLTDKTIVADYKYVKIIETSPFLHNAEMFEHMVADVKKKNVPMWFPYSLTRGCPYSCTFCDWNSGFSNKLSRRKNTYKQEIDLFQKLGIKHIYLADANVGQYDEDVEMIEYFAEKNLNENAGFHVGGNFSKLRKENNLKIFHAMIRGRLFNKTINFSIQDTNEDVLKNIDRPDVGWETHVAMANELREKYPQLVVKAQLIYGLPGQTLATWKRTLDQVTQQNILPVVFLNEPLPASPAMYNPMYQQQFEFEYVVSNRISPNGIYPSKIPKKSKFFNQQDLVQMNVLSGIYIALSLINFALKENNMPGLSISAVVDEFLQNDRNKNLCDNLYYNWTTHNNFYYTMNFSGQTTKTADFGLGVALTLDLSFLKYIATFFSTNDRLKFLLMVANAKFQKMANEIDYDID